MVTELFSDLTNENSSFFCRYVLEEMIETEKLYVADLGLIVEVRDSTTNYTGNKRK